MAGAPRAALRLGRCGFISITRTIARGVTDMGVGSGALLGFLALDTRTRNMGLGFWEATLGC